MSSPKKPTNMDKIKVEKFTIEVTPKDTQSTPNTLIAQFSNGKIKRPNDIQFELLQHEKVSSTGKRKLKLVAETNEMTYIGENEGLYAPMATKQYRYMVGVLDKKAAKMRVFDTEMFHMRPAIIAEPKIQEDDKDEVDNTKTFIQKNDELTSAFGSSKRKKAMNSRIKNKLKEDVLEEAVGSAVRNAMSAPDAETKLATPKKSDLPENIPPVNREATKSEDVYNLADIISKEEITALQSVVKVFVESDVQKIHEWTTAETYPHFILQQLSVLPIQAESRLHRACCLMYLYFMMKLYQLRPNALNSKAPFPSELSIPDIVKKKLFEKFTLSASNKRVMPARLKDKLLSYMLVLCLILDEFSLDTSPLQQDLKIGDSRIAQFLRTLGCKTKKENVQLISGITAKMTIATLPVPVTFPELREKKGKGKRQ